MKLFARIRVLLSLTLCLFGSTAVAEDRVLKLASTEFPPFYGAELEGNGFVTEILREAFDRGGYQIEVDFLPWKRAMSETERGRYDGLFTMWYREDREESFAFSDTLPANEYVFFKRADLDVAFNTLEDLKPYKIGVVRGYAPPPTFDPEAFKTLPANDNEENLRKLIRGRVDFVLTDRIVALHILNTVLAEDAAAVVQVGKPLSVETQHFVIPKTAEGYEALMAAFNAGLEEIGADGALSEILNRYGFEQ